MTKAKKDSESDWTTTSIQNLVRHEPSGRYYIRARVGRKEAVRKSLRTSDFGLAKVRVAQELARLRTNAPVRRDAMPETLWDALKVVRERIEADPALKRRSVRSYLDVFKALAPDLRPVEKRTRPKFGMVPLVPFGILTTRDMEDWWQETAKHFAPATANFHLLLVRRALTVARDTGAIHQNPARELRRLHIPPTKLRLITPAEFSALVAAIRADEDEDAGVAADWVEFACYTGCRPEEVNAVRWEHIGTDFFTVVGGEEGTKNRQTRRVPVMPKLADLLERIGRKTSGPVLKRGKVPGKFGKILARVSEAIGLPRLRRYDLRHLFATRCNEAGVDVPTFSRWLGHKDGGALAMKTYVHVHRDHEHASAAKVRF